MFTVDPSGMGSLHRDARAWALAARRAVGAHGFVCSVAVGFDRRAAHAIARCARRVVVARTVDEERALAADVPLAALGLHAREVLALAALGLRTLGDLWSLPPDTVRHRFGPAVAELRAWITDDARVPVQPEVPREALRTVVELETPDDDLPRLLFGLRGALHLLAARLAGRGEAIAALTLTLSLEDHTRVEHRVESAIPTRDVALLVELARLRLSEAALPARVAEMEVLAAPAPLRGEQLSLFAHDRARDRNAAARAMARVRAAFGERSVTRARLREAHLPEARFAWEPVAAPPRARRGGGDGGGGGRRAGAAAGGAAAGDRAGGAARAVADAAGGRVPVAARGRRERPAGGGRGGGGRVDARDAVARERRVVGARGGARLLLRRGRRGELLWVFYDGVRRRWFVQAVVDWGGDEVGWPSLRQIARRAATRPPSLNARRRNCCRGKRRKGQYDVYRGLGDFPWLPTVLPTVGGWVASPQNEQGHGEQTLLRSQVTAGLISSLNGDDERLVKMEQAATTLAQSLAKASGELCAPCWRASIPPFARMTPRSARPGRRCSDSGRPCGRCTLTHRFNWSGQSCSKRARRPRRVRGTTPSSG